MKIFIKGSKVNLKVVKVVKIAVIVYFYYRIIFLGKEINLDKLREVNDVIVIHKVSTLILVV